MSSHVHAPPLITDPEEVMLIPWFDRRTDAFGHDPRSTYVEHFWLATLGPSTTWFLRGCADLLDDTGCTRVNLRETARILGIGHEGGSRSAMARTVARACRFRAARSVGSSTLAVRVRLPQLSQRQLQRLPKSMQRRHDEFIAAATSLEAARWQQPRVRRLAACLIECGDSIGEAERQLARLRFHPAVIADAVRRAWILQHPQRSPEAA